ncbi:deoxynucleotide monophosphate kinase family protein [Streptomyces xanthophaeus]
MNIGLIGRARSGKDTVGRMLYDHGGYERVAFADPLKAAALKLNPIVKSWAHGDGLDTTDVHLSEAVADVGWEAAKEVREVRRILQELGGAMRSVDPEIWLRAGLARAEEVNRTTGRPVVITDVRYPNEAASLARSGFRLVYIDRPGVPHLDHESEGALTEDDAAFTITNSGSLDDLKERVHEVWSAIHTDESRRHFARSLS